MQPTNENRRAEEEIRRLDHETHEAMLRRDVWALDHLLAEDFVVTNPLYQIRTKRQHLETVQAAVQTGRRAVTAFEGQVEYLRIYGEGAVIMGKETVVDAGQTIYLRYTEMWVQ